MHRKTRQLQIAAAVLLAVASLASVLLATGTPQASAAIRRVDYRLRGIGLEKKGRPLQISILVTNVSRAPGTVPETVKRITFGSRAIGFNPRARGVSICRSRIPNNGQAPDCARSSVVGHGRVEGLLGTPGSRDDEFGILSEVAGRFTLYNYKKRTGETARLVAVVDTEKPFAGLAINLQASIDRFGEVIVKVPKLSKLPPFISKSYPSGTQLALTRLSATVGSADGRNAFATTRRSGYFYGRLLAEG